MAIPAHTVWETRTTGAQTNGGGFVWTSLVSATYKWTKSGSGTDEYYCEAAAGGNPSLTTSGSVMCDGNYNLSAVGTVGSLAAGQHAFGNNDSLGYTTLYVRLANGFDPDVMIGRGQPNYISYGAGGTDYSQQAAAQLSLTDIATDGAGTGLSSATGGFTAAMKNNIVYLSEGGVTANWYHITAVASANACTIDRTAGANKTGVTGNVGGAFLLNGSLANAFFVAKTAGNLTWLGGGTHTLSQSVTPTAGTAWTALMRLIGYNSTRGDNPRLDDRPYISSLTSSTVSMSGFVCANFRAESGDTFFYSCLNSFFFNVKCVETGTASTRYCWYSTSGNNLLVGCEAQCATASNLSGAFHCVSTDKLVGCYAHDSKLGFFNGVLVNCVADTCDVGFRYSSAGLAVNCTAFGCTTSAVTANFSNANLGVVNCAFDNNLANIVCTAAGTNEGICSVHNCMDGTTSFTKAVSWFGDIFGDPGLNDPANGDFSVNSADTNVYEQAADVGYFTSATV